MNYTVAPGLYGIGEPSSNSPVLVTANYKLTFDVLRKEMAGLNVWILVVDTRGINVWCAAGKKTFSTQEVVQRVKLSSLDRVVDHRKLILPQLSATGVSAQQVKKGCGFKVVWGPVRAVDIKSFLTSGMKADTDMRRVTFSFPERVVLIPVELSVVLKQMVWLIILAFPLVGSRTLAGSSGLDRFSPRLAVVEPCCRPRRGIVTLDTNTGICFKRSHRRVYNRHRCCLDILASGRRMGCTGPSFLHGSYQFLPGDEFYRIDALYLDVRCRKRNAQGPAPANGCRTDDRCGVGWVGLCLIIF